MNRGLIIDGQVFQTPAWHRGMGKYSFELILALVNRNLQTNKWQGIKLILSRQLNIDAGALKMLKTLPNVEIVYLDLKPNEFDNRPVAQSNRKVASSYLDIVAQNDGLTEIDYLILSLMQSEIAPAFPGGINVNKMLLFYDLIPFMLHDIYLRDVLNNQLYLTKLAELLKTDSYFAISKTVANDLSLYLGIDKYRICSIDGAPIKHGSKPKSLKVPHPFILMPTGNDLRKNNRRGIQGFDIFNKRNSEKYNLVVTSSFTEAEMDEYKKLCPKVFFTGNVSGEELEYLYRETDALLFPTEYEGLGLPILEALEKDKPVACSNISVFREMSQTAFMYFNPHDIEDIANSLERTINFDLKIYKKEYARILAKYSWPEVANAAIRRIDDIHKVSAAKPKKQLAVFSPDVSASLHGRIVQQGHAELSAHYDTDYFLETENRQSIQQRPNYLMHVTKTTDISQRSHIDLSTYSTIIYNITNSACPRTLLTALAVPGIVILHCTDLKGLWESALQNGLIDQTRFNLEAAIDKRYGAKGASFLTSIIYRQRAVIVYDDESRKVLESILTKMQTDTKPKVIIGSLMVGKPVYSDILPKNRKIIALIQTSDNTDLAKKFQSIDTAIPKKVIKPHLYSNDFEYMYQLSLLSACLIESHQNDDTSIIYAFDSIKLGSKAALVRKELDVRKDSAGIKIIQESNLENFIQTSMTDNSDKIPGGLTNHLQDNSSYAKRLHELIKSIEPDTTGGIE